MRSHGRILTVIALAMLPGAGGARASAPEKLFEEIFGPEAKQVSASPSKLDDADFAEKLLKSSRTLTDAPEFRVYLYQKAYEFGIACSKGYLSAQTALSHLDASAPDRRAEWDVKRLELYDLTYRNAQSAEKRAAGESYITQAIIVGDQKGAEGKWIEAASLYQQALAAATYIRSLQKDRAAEKLAQAEDMRDAQELRLRVEKEPDNTALRSSLVRLYVELDDPALAVPFLDPSVGEVWRTCVPLAAKEADTLPTQVCMELGNWYKSLAFSARPKAKPVLAKRAKDYYRTYLRKLVTEGATGQAIAEAREKINASLREVGQDKLADEVFFRDPAVQKAYDKALAYLWSQQTNQGAWQVYTGTSVTYSDGYYNTRSTAAVMLALFESGADIADDRMVRGMRWLETNNTPQTEGMALRSLVWAQAQRQRPGIYIRRLQKDVEALVLGTANGGYGSTVTSRSYTYCYYSWCAAWGVDAGVELGLKIPRKYWQLVLDYWTKQQKADGGWAYSGLSSSATGGQSSVLWSTMGMANTALALKHLYGQEAVKRMVGPECEPLRKGCAWMEKNFTSIKGLRDRYSPTYYYDPEYVMVDDGLWQLSLLGRLIEKKKIGQVEWFADGANHLAGTQSANGSWGGVIGTARAVCFLINGQRFMEQTGGLGVPVAPLTPVTPTLGIIATDDPVKQIALKKVDLMKTRLAENPDSQTVAQELVRLYVVELQSPAHAEPYAGKTGKAETGKLLGLAAKDLGTLAEADCQELGDWFVELAPGSSIPGRKYALAQAVACYKRFLDLHPTGDAARLKGKLALQKAEQALGEIKE